MAAKIRVVLADDHTVLREATAEVIDHQPDMQVVGQAGTGEKTLDLVRALHPDIVVLDIAMPKMDGLEVARQVSSKYPGTKVLVLSAHQDADHVLPLLEAGATGYLPKTISLNELLDAIRVTSRGESVLPPSIASTVVGRLSGKTRGEACGLTVRELKVLSLVARGCTNDYIANSLGVSTRTVESHLTHIYTKLNVNSRTEAAILAQRKGWLREEEDPAKPAASQ